MIPHILVPKNKFKGAGHIHLKNMHVILCLMNEEYERAIIRFPELVQWNARALLE